MLSRTQQVIRIKRDPEEPLSARTQAFTYRKPQAKINEISGRPNMENAIKPNNQLRGCRKIRGTNHGVEHKQSQEPKSNMGDPEDTLSVTKTNTQNENSTDTDNNQFNTLSGRGTRG